MPPGAEQPPGFENNAQSKAESESFNTNKVSFGDFNVGAGAGSSGMIGLVIIGVLVGLYIFMANRK